MSIGLRWRRPEGLTARFRTLVEGACGLVSIWPRITRDYSEPDENAAASGSVPTSRHLHGEGVDFDIPEKGHGVVVGPLVVALIHVRACQAGLAMPPFRDFLSAVADLEIELVANAKDSHLHVALDPKQTLPAIFGATT